MASVVGSVALREWFIKDGCSWSDAGLKTTYDSDFMEMLGIPVEDQETLRKESVLYQAAKAIQNAWRKFDSARPKFTQCESGNCGECNACYYDSVWCCPTCGDQCEYTASNDGFCSDFCYFHAHEVYNSYAEAAHKRDAYEEAQKRIQEDCENYDPHDEHDEFVPCSRCGADASGQGYPGTFCSRACFAYYD